MLLATQNTERQGTLYRFALVLFVCILVLNGTYFRHRQAVAVPTMDWYVLLRAGACGLSFLVGVALLPKRIVWGWGARLAMCYIFTVILSVMTSRYPVPAAGYVILILGASSLMLALVYHARDLADLEYIQRLWVLTVSALVLKDAVTALFFVEPPSAINDGRLGMGVTHATELSLFAALLFWISFGTRTGRHRMIWWVWRVFLLYVIVAAKSRISIVGFVSGGFCYFVFSTRDFVKRGIVISVAGCLMVFLLLAITFGQTWAGGMADYMKRGQDTKELASFTGRSYIWKHIIGKASEAPIMGHGYGVSRLTMGAVPGMNWEPPHCHNEALEVFFNTGLLGLVPFIGMIIYNLKWIWHSSKLQYIFSRTLALHALCLVVMLLVSFMFEVRLSGKLTPIQPLYFFYLFALDRAGYFRRLAARQHMNEA